MIPRPPLVTLGLLAGSLGLQACAPAPASAPSASAQPVAVGAPAHAEHAAGPRTLPPGAKHTLADARFMEHMIHHHAQALEMTRHVPARTTRPDLRLIAERIAVSQHDEIAQMQRWLRTRGHDVPQVAASSHAAHSAGAHAGMPGMATPAELDRLAAARGTEFERLFLELMIRHHEGALVMVQQLFASPGAAQESETFNIVSEIDADQRMEIDRLRRLLANM